MSTSVGEQRQFETVGIQGVQYRLWPAADPDLRAYVPRPKEEEELERYATICYPGDEHMPLLLLGRPGTGKSMLAAALAKRLGLPFWKMNAHNSLDAADLTCFARFKEQASGGNNIEYVLSPFASGAYVGGLAFLDDCDKSKPETLGSILGLLDGEKVIASGLGAVNIPVHPAARFVFAANEELALPEFFRSRVFKVKVDFIPIEQTLEIVKRSGAIPHADIVLDSFRNAWQRNRPAGREAPSLREAFRACRCLAKLANGESSSTARSHACENRIIHGVTEVS